MNPKTIVLADGSYTIRKILELTLSDHDSVKLVSLASGETLPQTLRELRPSILLVDTKLPGTDGYQACRLIQNDPELANTHVFLLKGGFEAMDDDLLADLAFEDVITKPFDHNALVKRMLSLLESMPAGESEPIPPPPSFPEDDGPENEDPLLSEAFPDEDGISFSDIKSEMDTPPSAPPPLPPQPPAFFNPNEEIMPSEEITQGAQPERDRLAPDQDDLDNPFLSTTPGTPPPPPPQVPFEPTVSVEDTPPPPVPASLEEEEEEGSQLPDWESIPSGEAVQNPMPDMGATQTFAQISSSQAFSSPFADDDLDETAPEPPEAATSPVAMNAENWPLPEDTPSGPEIPATETPEISWGFGDEDEEQTESPQPQPPTPQEIALPEPDLSVNTDMPPPLPETPPLWEETTPPPIPEPAREDSPWASTPEPEAPVLEDDPIPQPQEPEPALPAWEEQVPEHELPPINPEPAPVVVEEQENLWPTPEPPPIPEPVPLPEAEPQPPAPMAFQAPQTEATAFDPAEDPVEPSGFGWDAPEPDPAPEPAFEAIEQEPTPPEPAFEPPYEEPPAPEPAPVATPVSPETPAIPDTPEETSPDAGLNPQEKALLLHRVEEKLSQGIREVLWEILPDLTERIIREEIAQIRKEISDNLTD